MAAARGCFGEFGNSYEYGGGVKWHFLPTERLWLNAELFRVNKAPYSGAWLSIAFTVTVIANFVALAQGGLLPPG